MNVVVENQSITTTATTTKQQQKQEKQILLLDQYKALISAIFDLDLFRVIELLQIEPRLVELRDIYGNTPMHVALQQQQEQQQLMSFQENDNDNSDNDDDHEGNDRDGEHGRRRKSTTGGEEEEEKEESSDEVQLLSSIIEHIIVEYSYVLIKADGLNRTPLHVAISSHTPDLHVIGLLIEYSPPQVISFGDDTGSTPLHLAAGLGNIPTILISKMMNINCKYTTKAISMIDDNGRTVLHEACRPCHNQLHQINYDHGFGLFGTTTNNNNHDVSQHNDNNNNGYYNVFLQCLLDGWPTSSLVLDEYGKLPYDDAIRNMYSLAPETTQFVGNATKNVICSMIEALYSCYNNQLLQQQQLKQTQQQSLSFSFTSSSTKTATTPTPDILNDNIDDDEVLLFELLDTIIKHIESTFALSVISSEDILQLRSSTTTSNISLLLHDKFQPHMSEVLIKRLIDQPDLQTIFKGKDDDDDDVNDENEKDENESDDDNDNDDVDNDDDDQKTAEEEEEDSDDTDGSNKTAATGNNEESNKAGATCNNEEDEDTSSSSSSSSSDPPRLRPMIRLRNLIHDLYRMDNAGRYDYLRDDPGNKCKGVNVLSSVSNSCNGLYWHLRENPTLISA